MYILINYTHHRTHTFATGEPHVSAEGSPGREEEQEQERKGNWLLLYSQSPLTFSVARDSWYVTKEDFIEWYTWQLRTYRQSHTARRTTSQEGQWLKGWDWSREVTQCVLLEQLWLITHRHPCGPCVKCGPKVELGEQVVALGKDVLVIAGSGFRLWLGFRGFRPPATIHRTALFLVSRIFYTPFKK